MTATAIAGACVASTSGTHPHHALHAQAPKNSLTRLIYTYTSTSTTELYTPAPARRAINRARACSMLSRTNGLSQLAPAGSSRCCVGVDAAS
jgi:hypothetical protein